MERGTDGFRKGHYHYYTGTPCPFPKHTFGWYDWHEGYQDAANGEKWFKARAERNKEEETK